MATGDAVTQIYNVAASSSVTFQPAPGVEIAVTWIQVGSTGYCYLTDGANNAQIAYAAAFNGRVFISNSKYLLFTQGSSGAVDGFSGVQTKG
jgi:hypothetical protein